MKRYRGLIRYCIKLDYTSNPEALIKKRENEGGVITLFLSFCLHATGIMRLFDKEGIEEFLFRLAVIFKDFGIVENFFTNDSFIVFEHEGYKWELSLNDIIEHFGIEISDSAYDMVTRESWLANTDKYWTQSCVGAVYSNLPLVDKVFIGDDKYKIGSNKPKAVTDEYNKVIELFVKEAIKTIGNAPFEDLSLRVIEQKKGLEVIKKYYETKPRNVFKYSSVPLNVKKQFFQQIFGAPASDHEADFAEVVNEEESYLYSLIYLAWLWVNGYVTVQEVKMGKRISHYAEVDPRMPFNYERYDGLNKLGIGVNLYDSYWDHRLDKLEHLLKANK